VNKLEYEYTKPGHPPHDPTSFRIQASSIGKYFSNTAQWYRGKLLGEPSQFGDSTSSVLGTALHWAAENYIAGTLDAAAKQEMYDYIMIKAESNPDLIDEPYIRNNLTPMWRVLREYINSNPGGLPESFAQLEILPGITVGGSIDLIQVVGDESVYTNLDQLRGKTVNIIDWKTTSSLNPPKQMDRAYQWQLLTYAYVLHKLYGITTDTISNVYITHNQVNRISEKTGKPMKDYPSTVTPITVPVTQDDLDFIESVIQLIAHSVHRFVTTPADRFLIAQDYRLVGNTAQLPFTSIGQPTSTDI